MSRFRGLRRLAVAIVAIAVGAVGLVSGTSGTAGATGSPGRSTTVEYTLPVPALALENVCYLDAVILNGDLHIRTTTTSLADGGVRVVSTINGRNLTGFGLPSALDYKGENHEYTYSYTAPPPGIGTFQVVQYTKLDPQGGNAPTMYLVVVLRQVVLADLTTVPVIERMYLVCQQPKCSHKKV